MTLTATMTRGAVSRTKEFEVTVLAEELDDAGKAQEAVDAIELVHPDDVRGNLTLPATGLARHGVQLGLGEPGVVRRRRRGHPPRARRSSRSTSR